MTRTGTFLLMAAMGMASASCATLEDTEPLAHLPPFRDATAIVFDEEKNALFRSDRGFALAAAGNTAGRAFAFEQQMVRITPTGRPELWIRCADLEAGLTQCGEPKTEVAQVPRSLPFCPGDPRCPKRNPRDK